MPAIGVKLIGRFAGINDGKAQFSGSLRNQCAISDLKMGRLLDTIDELPGPSLERDVFEKLPAGTLNTVTGEGAFIDIGTPDDLARAADVLKPYAQDS